MPVCCHQFNRHAAVQFGSSEECFDKHYPEGDDPAEDVQSMKSCNYIQELSAS